MARIIQNKFPIDLTPSIAVGFGFPLDGPAVFKPTFTTREQTKANLINYLLTNKGERVFRPNFGGDLRNLLFEGILESTQSSLITTIFENQEDRNEINFILIYQIVNFGIEDSINIELQ